MEAIPEREQVLTGTFSLNGCPIIILFDSGATHDFISKAYTQKYQLLIAHTHTPYRISTPGGNIITKQGQGIDVILGMGWMKEHKALLDTAARTMQLNTPDHGMVTLQLSSYTAVAPSAHHTTTQTLEDIPVAREFPVVFPEDLLGMPPNRDVEFTIELQPGTAAISRRSYKMTPKELALGLFSIVCEEERSIIDAMC
jgi:hypothetical protein